MISGTRLPFAHFSKGYIDALTLVMNSQNIALSAHIVYCKHAIQHDLVTRTIQRALVYVSDGPFNVKPFIKNNKEQPINMGQGRFGRVPKVVV